MSQRSSALLDDRPERRRPRRRRALKVAIAVLLALVLALVAVVGYLGYVGSRFDAQTEKIEQAFPDESTRPPKQQPAGAGTAPGGGTAPDAVPGSGAAPAQGSAADGGARPASSAAPVNILLVGSDSRDTSGRPQAGAGEASNQRSDTMMLVHIPADRQRAYIVSVMRDLWVTIPGHGQAKINASLAYGGVPLLVQTLESLLKQRIDHVTLVDFAGFEVLTDTLGGVTLDVGVPFTSSIMEGKRFDAGTQTMDGKTALAFVRERYAFPDGDYQRVRNQQAFIKAVLRQMGQPGTLANPVTLGRLVDGFSPYLAVDKGLDSRTLAQLAFELRDVRPSEVISFTLPTSGIGTSADGQSIVLLDAGATSGLAAAMAGGTVPEFVRQRGLEDGN